MKTILIVDDTNLNLKILIDLLSSDYNVISTNNGKDAIKIAREEHPDLILLDIIMPILDGFEVCHILQTIPSTRDIPIIFLTAMANEESIEKAYDLGGADYITKPFKPKELLSRVKKELKIKNLIKILETSQRELTKLANDNLEYASFVQESLLPNSDEIERCFDDFFIIYNKKEVVSPLIYSFIKINEDEYVFFIIDCHIKGIKSAFYTMFLSSIEKEFISCVHNNKDLEINSVWIYEYFNKAIKEKLLQDENLKYHMAIIYYNKKTNKLKHTGNDSLFWFVQNNIITDTLHTVDPTQEITIDIKEGLTFYISTKEGIKDKISKKDIEDYHTLELENQKIEFDNKLAKLYDTVLCAFRIDNKVETIIEYEGKFNQNLLGEFTDNIEDKITNIGVISNISTILAEQFQNIMNYSKKEDSLDDEIASKGYISLKENNNEYILTSKNIISKDDKEKIEPKIKEIKSLDREGLRKRYKELRKSGINKHESGAGIGFFEIAKRCHKIKYEFKDINKHRVLFTYKSILLKSK
jgi:CheY-like chemotaxis protein